MWKGVHPFEYMDDWEKFNETLLLEILLMQITHTQKEFVEVLK